MNLTQRGLTVTILTRAIASLHPPGGMERAVAEQVHHLNARGVNLTVVTQPPDTRVVTSTNSAASPGADNWPTSDHAVGPTAWDWSAPTLDWRYVSYGALPVRRNSVPDRLINYPWFVRRVSRVLHREPDLCRVLVHGHGLLATAAPAGRTLVYAPHGLEEFSRVDWRKWLAYAPMRRALVGVARRANAVIATDGSMVQTVTSALKVARDKVVVVPNGVSVARIDGLRCPERAAGLATRLNLGQVSPRFVTCARLETNKGLHILLRALAGIGEYLPPDWGWWVVGSGKEEEHLRREVATLGLSNHVHFVGNLDEADLHNLLPQMDMFLLPSLYEGSSIATLEAMTHALPVIATSVGGLPDKVIPGRTGFLCRPGDVSALSASILVALSQRQQWRNLGSQGRQLVLERFDWTSIVDQLVDVYTTLLASGQ